MRPRPIIIEYNSFQLSKFMCIESYINLAVNLGAFYVLLMDGPLEKWWGGGVHFQRAWLFFQNVLLCRLFFFYNPLLEFYFFPKIVGERGGGGWWSSGLKHIFPDKFFLKHDENAFFAPISATFRFRKLFLTPLLISKNVPNYFFLFFKFGAHPYIVPLIGPVHL